MLRNRSDGFVLAEFAIALPLLILLGWSLAAVSVKTFQLGKDQLADYVLEEEAQYVMERIIQQARVAKEIEIKKFTADIHQLKIVYLSVNEHPINSNLYIAAVRETQYYIPHENTGKNFYDKLNAKRQELGALNNPISGDNSFGETKINILRYKPDASKKILHITLELESLVTERKIKISTAVFMPSCGKFEVT